jgi:hypothetical protein
MLSGVIMLATLFGIVFGVCILFLPTGVAKIRNHPNTLAIFVLNLFLGWTFVGWVAALVWACITPVPHFAHIPGPALPLDAAQAQAAFRSSSAAALRASAPYQGQR